MAHDERGLAAGAAAAAAEAQPGPPLSSLGLKLCRSTGNPRDFRRDVKWMTEASIPLQFDGDCIDEQLVKTAFELNPAYSTLENDFSLLADFNIVEQVRQYFCVFPKLLCIDHNSNNVKEI